MAPLYSEGFDEILNAASQYDDYVQGHYVMFTEEEDWQTLYQFFLRGKDMVSLIQFAFDLGRLVGRAHHVLEMEN